MAEWGDLGLSDDPFDPASKPDVPARLLQDLVVKPLQVHIDPRLKSLYCPTLGQFATHLDDFRAVLRRKGYSQQPPHRGNHSFTFAIRGPQGSGKSTLANVMIEWLKDCLQPEQPPWDIEERFRDQEYLSCDDQKEELKKLEGDIDGKAVTSHCIVLDNIVAGAETAAFAMWDRLYQNRSVVMFLIASDLPLLKRGFQPRYIHTFETGTLSPDDGVKFITHRINLFRTATWPWLARYPLFPFVETNIREMLAAPPGEKESVTLRVFSTIVHEALTTLLDGMDGFDGANATPQQVERTLIQLEEAVRNAVRDIAA